MKNLEVNNQQEVLRKQNQLLFKPSQLIELLSLSRSTVYMLLKSNQIKSIRIGRARRVTPAAIDEWIANQVAA